MTSDTQVKARIRFRKEGPLRYISHHDLMRCWDRLFRRTKLPVKWTQGFHPKPALSSPLALGLGVTGWQEVLDVILTEPVEADDICQRLNNMAIPGLIITRVDCLPVKSPGKVEVIEYAAPRPSSASPDQLQRRWEQLLEESDVLVQRTHPRKGTRTVDVRPLLHQLLIDDEYVRMQVLVDPHAGTVRPEELLGLLGLPDTPADLFALVRSQVVLADDEKSLSAQG